MPSLVCALVYYGPAFVPTLQFEERGGGRGGVMLEKMQARPVLVSNHSTRGWAFGEPDPLCQAGARMNHYWD